jgi:DNA segregation ATPase FtsK/SpoIIIE, S-DNA-T family
MGNSSTRSRSAGGSRQPRSAGKEMLVAAWLVRHPGMWLVPGLVGAGLWVYGWLRVVSVLGGVAGGVLIWWRAHPASFDRWAAIRLRSGWRRWGDYRGRRWADLLFECDLTRDNRLTGDTVTPRIERVHAVTPSIDVLRVRLIRGQDLRTWTDRSEMLAEALCVHRVAVAKTRHKPGRVTVVVERKNPFDQPLPAPEIPSSAAEIDFAGLDVGDDEFGNPVLVSVVGGAHPLVVGATGSGKGSLMWGMLRQLAPAIRDGWVRVHMIDLKGGTETEIGKSLFHRRAITVENALELLRDAREEMQATQQRLLDAGLRRAVLSPEWPLDLIIIDEMAMLTAYADRHALREALGLLAEMMTQGRNTLFTVAGFIQEPSKDILEIRELFTSRFCLGVTAASHVDMALGDGARDRGALADEIPLDEEHAGIGFRVDKGSRLPRRFRLGFTSDAEIIEMAALYHPTPRGTGRLTALPGGKTESTGGLLEQLTHEWDIEEIPEDDATGNNDEGVA